MDNLFMNLIKSIFTNPITITFIIITIVYSAYQIIKNNSIYEFIQKYLDDIEINGSNSQIYVMTKQKYEKYQGSKLFTEINLTTFIEEISSEFKFKKSYLMEEVKSIKNTSANCILIGVLGTFIGLSLMLSTIDTSDVINSLPKTIGSMQTAFVTSILGILCSMIISFITKQKDCEHLLVQVMLKLENMLTSELNNVKSTEMNDKIEEIKITIKQISKSIEAIEKFDKISQDLNDFNKGFIGGIEKFKVILEDTALHIRTFDQNIRKLDKQFNVLNVKFTKIFDKYDNLDDITKDLLVDIKEASNNISNSTQSQLKTKEYIKNMSASFAIYERSIQDLFTKLITHEEKMILKQEDLDRNTISIVNKESKLSTNVEELSKSINEFSKQVQEKLNMLYNLVDVYKEASYYVELNNEINEEIYEVEASIEEELDEVELEQLDINELKIDKDDLYD